MKKVLFAALAALGIMSTAAYAVTPIKVGATNSLPWYICFDPESPVTVMNNAKLAGLDESFKTWGLLESAGKCSALPMPVPLKVTKVIAQAEIPNEKNGDNSGPLVLTVIELEDTGGNHAWALTGEPVIQ